MEKLGEQLLTLVKKIEGMGNRLIKVPEPCWNRYGYPTQLEKYQHQLYCSNIIRNFRWDDKAEFMYQACILYWNNVRWLVSTPTLDYIAYIYVHAITHEGFENPVKVTLIVEGDNNYLDETSYVCERAMYDGLLTKYFQKLVKNE